MSSSEANHKLTVMWMYATQMGLIMPPLAPYQSPLRKMKLIPATSACEINPLTNPPLVAANIILPPRNMQYYNMSQRYLRTPTILPPHCPGPVIYAPLTCHPRGRTKSFNLNSPGREQYPIMGGGRASHAGSRAMVSRRPRRKSDTDAIDGGSQAAFRYTGLDRLIADNFLAHQEKSNGDNYIDCSSTSPSATTSECGVQTTMSRTTSKMKIICNDVRI